jgi:hypothetical protein
MWPSLKATLGWLWTAVAILGVIFSFLFFGTKADSSLNIVWVYALVFFLMSILVWVMGALVFAVKEKRQTVAKIRSIFSASENLKTDLSFLLDPNDSFGSLLKCSIFYLENGVELYLGGGYVYNVQEDKRVQLKVSSRELSKESVWNKIEANDKDYIERILVKVGERMQ